MIWTTHDVETEHRDALASLTPVPHRALKRLQHAGRLAAFNHHRSAENLQAMFETEAVRLHVGDRLAP